MLSFRGFRECYQAKWRKTSSTPSKLHPPNKESGFPNPLILNQIHKSVVCPNPFLPPSAGDKALLFKQVPALGVQFVDDAESLVELQVVEKIVQAKEEGGLGMALVAVHRVDEDAYADVFINGVEVVKVEATDGSAVFGEVNHQAELLLAEQVVVVQ